MQHTTRFCISDSDGRRLASMSKTTNRIITIFFAGFIGIFFLLNLFLPDKVFSEKENRQLQTLPNFSFSSLFSGTFTTRFESYCSDQFAGRDGWIEIKAFFELIQGKKQNNGVFLCDDEMLIEPFSAPEKDALASALKSANLLTETGIPVSLALIPTAAEIYKDKLPQGAENDDQHWWIDEMHTEALLHSALNTVDLLPALSGHRDEYIFYRTDHHWTSIGAYYAANALRSSWGLPEIGKAELTPETVSDSFYGTLYSSSGFFWVHPDEMVTFLPVSENSYVTRYETNGTEEIVPLYNYEKLAIKDKYTFFLGGNIPRAVVTTGTENAPSLLILRDSYADSLVPFLTDAFSEIHLIDLRYYAGSVRDYVAEHDIDSVLLLCSIDNFCSISGQIF